MPNTRAPWSVRSTHLGSRLPLSRRCPWPFPLSARSLVRIVNLALTLYLFLAVLLLLRANTNRYHILCPLAPATIATDDTPHFRRFLP